MLELPLDKAQAALKGVMMELEDCAFPLLAGMVGTDDPRVAFKDADYALLVGARPRGPGMERKDLLEANAAIFSAQGQAINEVADGFDAIILDLPDHPPAIEACSQLRLPGGRLACYCPVSSQMERSWEACEAAGLTVEWAGELMEREWGRASKGGMRPVNGPFGHTAFLLVAQRQ